MNNDRSFGEGKKKESKIDKRLLDSICKSYKSATSVIINTKEMLKISTVLKDSDNKEVSMEETVIKTSNYAKESLKDKKHVLAAQIYPFLCSTMTHFVLDRFPKETAVMMLTHPLFKDVMASSVLHGFLLSQLLKSKDEDGNPKYKITSTETEISKQEIESLEKTSMVHDMTAAAALTGDLENLMEQMMDSKKKSEFGFDFGGDNNNEQ